MSGSPQVGVSNIVDIGAQIPQPQEYWFVASGSSTTTITGFWVNAAARQTGNSFSVNIAASGGTPVVIAATPPTDAVGAVITPTAAVRYSIAPTLLADFTSNPTQYPSFAAGVPVAIGRANVPTSDELALVAPSTGIPVAIALSTATDRSGTVTLGGTAQNAMAANTVRQGGYIFNPFTASESLYVSESGTATTSSPELKAGGMWEIKSTNAVSVLGATTSHAWAGEER